MSNVKRWNDENEYDPATHFRQGRPPSLWDPAWITAIATAILAIVAMIALL